MTPMQVQYLVALCCLRRNPDAVDIIVGDMVPDVAAGEERDIDVTVTLKEEDGTIRGFKGGEVKDEGRPLDVRPVEQLCMKFNDMPSITHRAIFSGSGFTEPAISKATAHGVELYTIKPWTKPLREQFASFPQAGLPSELLTGVESNLLCWVEPYIYLAIPSGPSSFKWDNNTPTFGADGRPHDKWTSMKAYRAELLLKSTGLLSLLGPVIANSRTLPLKPMDGSESVLVTPTWPHSHTFNAETDQVFLKLEKGLALIHTVTISGSLQWRQTKPIPEFYILERVPDGQAFAGAAVAELGGPDDALFAMTFSPESRTSGIHRVVLEEKHKNMIRKLRLEIPDAPDKTQPPDA